MADLAVVGDYVFAACVRQGFSVIDVSIPSSPVGVGQASTPDDARSVEVAGQYAYVAAGESGLRVIDVSDPTLPFEVGFKDTVGYASNVAVLKDVVYLAENRPKLLRAIDVTDPTRPVLISASRISASPSSVTVGDGYVFVTTGGTSLDVFRDCSTWIFVDDFESGDASNWSVEVP